MGLRIALILSVPYSEVEEPALILSTAKDLGVPTEWDSCVCFWLSPVP